MVCFIQKSLTARSLFIHPAFTASISAWVGGANKIFLYIPTKTSSSQQEISGNNKHSSQSK
jgi:hypothetical protein